MGLGQFDLLDSQRVRGQIALRETRRNNSLAWAVFASPKSDGSKPLQPVWTRPRPDPAVQFGCIQMIGMKLKIPRIVLGHDRFIAEKSYQTRPLRTHPLCQSRRCALHRSIPGGRLSSLNGWFSPATCNRAFANSIEPLRRAPFKLLPQFHARKPEAPPAYSHPLFKG